MKFLALLIGILGLSSCTPQVERIRGSITSLSQEDPAISGDGKKLAVIVDKNGLPTVQLRDLRSGKLLSLRHLARHRPHSSPSLSWNGRYLAVIAQRGSKRIALIEDRVSGRIHQLILPAERLPVRVSLAPNATQLALQFTDHGKWRIQLFDLSVQLEPDQPGGFIRPSLGSNIQP